VPRLDRQPHILGDAESRKEIGDLKGTADTGARDLFGSMTGDRLADQ
jgi:hypothetical protein